MLLPFNVEQSANVVGVGFNLLHSRCKATLLVTEGKFCQMMTIQISHNPTQSNSITHWPQPIYIFKNLLKNVKVIAAPPPSSQTISSPTSSKKHISFVGSESFVFCVTFLLDCAHFSITVWYGSSTAQPKNNRLLTSTPTFWTYGAEGKSHTIGVAYSTISKWAICCVLVACQYAKLFT